MAILQIGINLNESYSSFFAGILIRAAKIWKPKPKGFTGFTVSICT